jgi:hypothetical protein
MDHRIGRRPIDPTFGQMLELVHEKARILRLASMSMIVICDTTQLKWYKSHGFIVQSYKPHTNDPHIKVFLMRKHV